MQISPPTRPGLEALRAFLATGTCVGARSTPWNPFAASVVANSIQDDARQVCRLDQFVGDANPQIGQIQAQDAALASLRRLAVHQTAGAFNAARAAFEGPADNPTSLLVELDGERPVTWGLTRDDATRTLRFAMANHTPEGFVLQGVICSSVDVGDSFIVTAPLGQGGPDQERKTDIPSYAHLISRH